MRYLGRFENQASVRYCVYGTGKERLTPIFDMTFDPFHTRHDLPCVYRDGPGVASTIV